VFCRQGAQDLSTLTPLLSANNVKNIAIGLEEFGLEEFVEGKYFNGDLYVDIGKQSYKDIGYYKYSTPGVLLSLLTKKARDAIAKSKADKLPGNLKGDGLQTGGTLVITKGGVKVLLDFRQDNPADHVDAAEVLKVLGIADTRNKSEGEASGSKY